MHYTPLSSIGSTLIILITMLLMMRSKAWTSPATKALRLPRLTLSMKLNCGIVGLPNVGKSTLFNALVGSEAAQAANFPFCTIEPNTGLVNVPDKRLEKLGVINKSAKVVPAVMEFVDIAGIVKGASEGAGLGNKFLSNIRMTDAIVHVVRCFVNDDIIHVDGNVNPSRDIDVINLELILADMAQIEKRLERVKKDKKVVKEELSGLEKVQQGLADGLPARAVTLTVEERNAMKSLMLLTMKPVIYAANVADSDLAKGNTMSEEVFSLAAKENSKAVLVSAQVEAELAGLSVEDRQEFLSTLGVTETGCGLNALVRVAYDTLGLQTYFTSGPTETRAWTILKGSTAPQAAGVIHSDFEKGFIRAETIAYDDLIRLGSEKAVKDAGLLRSEGKDYVMQEGDVVLFRFNV